MKQETFEKAKELERQINHIDDLFLIVKTEKLSLNPPTRFTSFEICDKYNKIILYESELLALQQALKKEKERLKQEFADL